MKFPSEEKKTLFHHVQHSIFPLGYLSNPIPSCHVDGRPLALFLKANPENQTRKTTTLLPHLCSTTMKKTSRGFRFPLGRKMVKLWKWALLKSKQKPRGYIRLNPVSGSLKNKTMTKICNWGRCLRKTLCQSSQQASKDSLFEEKKTLAVPKGHLAVYVGEKEDDTHRYLVPVIYFNHPLFTELLREAEEEYGFHHPRGITIPCRVAEFENVQTRIAGERGRKLTRRFRSS